jgi:hypothetical protein
VLERSLMRTNMLECFTIGAFRVADCRDVAAISTSLLSAFCLVEHIPSLAF